MTMTSGESVSDVPILRTDRLTLRAWRDTDRDPFAAMNADPDVMEHFPAPLSRTESDTMIDRAIAIWAEGGPCWWALETLEGEFIGFVGLYRPTFEAHFTPCTEIGWRLAKHAWGQGYATEAATAALSWGFHTLKLAEIVSFTVPQNHRSRRVMVNLGMRHDPDDDWDHPRLMECPRMKRHVLYRLRAIDWAAH